jgi:hypothetical protein
MSEPGTGGFVDYVVIFVLFALFAGVPLLVGTLLWLRFRTPPRRLSWPEMLELALERATTPSFVIRTVLFTAAFGLASYKSYAAGDFDNAWVFGSAALLVPVVFGLICFSAPSDDWRARRSKP